MSDSVKGKCRDCGRIYKLISALESGMLHYYCADHWGIRFAKEQFKTLHRSLRSIGLERKPNETKKEWGRRCREYAIKRFPLAQSLNRQK